MFSERYYATAKKFLSRSQLSVRHAIYGVCIVAVLLVSATYALRLSPYAGHGSIVYTRAKVVSVQLDTSIQFPGNNQKFEVKILDGQDRGRQVTVLNSVFLGDGSAKRLPIGGEVLLSRDPSNGNQYLYLDAYRVPGAMLLFLLLLVLVIIIGKWRGFTAVVGLTISISVLVLFVLPRIIAGHDTFATCMEGAFIISTITIFIAHGFNKRTTVAFISSIGTLLIVVGLAVGSVYFIGLTGFSSEESFAIQSAAHPISLSGLLLGGIVIASLGVLDDITTGQAAVVDELHKANTKQSLWELYRRGLSVGREHIAALINTLALAYVGVALPTIVLTALYNHQPLLLVLNNEAIMEEVVRTGVASIGLLLAVPLATLSAAYLLPRWYARGNRR
jgi:uncharacterized membrane protein